MAWKCGNCGLVWRDEDEAEGCCPTSIEEVSNDNLFDCPDCLHTWFKPDASLCARCDNTHIVIIKNPIPCPVCKGSGRLKNETSEWDCADCNGWGHTDGDSNK